MSNRMKGQGHDSTMLMAHYLENSWRCNRELLGSLLRGSTVLETAWLLDIFCNSPTGRLAIRPPGRQLSMHQRHCMQGSFPRKKYVGLQEQQQGGRAAVDARASKAQARDIFCDFDSQIGEFWRKRGVFQSSPIKLVFCAVSTVRRTLRTPFPGVPAERTP